MPIEKVLIVDDEPLVRDFLQETLRRINLEVTAVENGKKAIEALTAHEFDMVFCDMIMPDLTGIDVLNKINELAPDTKVVFITAFGSIENAVEAMRLGAFNYIIKPFSPDTIDALVVKANENIALKAENNYLRQQVSKVGGKGNHLPLIAESPAMKKILNEINQVAKSNAAIFITGESGTGKEVIAHAIHYSSMRCNGPFIKVNCAAIPENLIESEFFGHEKGAFTGANNKHLGRFELANGGTLLLDEITETPLALQAKLLRVTQQQEFERVGGGKPIKVDVRLIATSNRNIKEAIAQKVLREDLYYRLNVIPIQIPPLRERIEDIIPLAEFILERVSLENHKPKKKFSSNAKKKLLAYSWPGNVRELTNIIERAVVLDMSAVIEAEHLHLEYEIKNKSKNVEFQNDEEEEKIEASLKEINEIKLPLGVSLEELEKRMIIETFYSKNEDLKQTAKALGISVKSLQNKLQHYEDTEGWSRNNE